MSLAINAQTVTAVLLADGWHDVLEKTFTVDSYEFLDGDSDNAYVLHGGGQSDVCASGFSFSEGAPDQVVSGPLTAVLAVRTQE